MLGLFLALLEQTVSRLCCGGSVSVFYCSINTATVGCVTLQSLRHDYMLMVYSTLTMSGCGNEVMTFVLYQVVPVAASLMIVLDLVCRL